MVQFTLPKNSKIIEGIVHKLKQASINPKKLIIYRLNLNKILMIRLKMENV